MSNNDKKLTTTIFIQRANEIHNYLYDYSNTIYINSRSNISYICSIHGKVEQNSHSHLRGSGCSFCNGNFSMTLKDFKNKAKEIHRK